MAVRPQWPVREVSFLGLLCELRTRDERRVCSTREMFVRRDISTRSERRSRLNAGCPLAVVCRFRRRGRRRYTILPQQRVVDFADDAAGLYGDLTLAVDGLLLRVHEERKSMRLFRKVAERQRKWRRERLRAVVDAELVEVARDDPSRLFSSNPSRSRAGRSSIRRISVRSAAVLRWKLTLSLCLM